MRFTDESVMALSRHVAQCPECVPNVSLCAEGQRLCRVCSKQLADEIDAEVGRRVYADVAASLESSKSPAK